MIACLSHFTREEGLIFSSLIEKRALLDVTDSEGFTALEHAKKRNNSLAIELIEAELVATGQAKPNCLARVFSFFYRRESPLVDSGLSSKMKAEI